MWPFNKPEQRSHTLDEIEAMFSTQARAGTSVTSDSAQQLTSVFSAISFISKGIASYSIRDSDRNSQIDNLFNRSPDGIMTAFDWRVAVMINLLTTGNAYSRVTFGNDGRPKNIQFLQSNRVSIQAIDNELKGYLVDGKPVLPKDMLHFRINSLDGINGRTPIAVCRDAIGLGLAQQDQASDQLSNGLKTSGVIEYPDFLNSTKGEKFRESLSKRKSGEMLILEGGATFNGVSMSNSDAEFLASRQFSVDEVARIFNLDKIWLQGSDGGAKYNEIGASQQALINNTYQPYLINIEQEIELKLLFPSEYSSRQIRFNLAEVQRLDPKSRYDIYKLAIDSAVLTAEEVKTMEGLA
ncbi:MAG: phage portal protein [Vibrio hibernica]